MQLYSLLVSDHFLSNQLSLHLICFITELVRINDSGRASIAHTLGLYGVRNLRRPQKKCRGNMVFWFYCRDLNNSEGFFILSSSEFLSLSLQLE